MIRISQKEHTIQYFSAWLALAMFLPFIKGFGEAPPEDAEQAIIHKTMVFPEGPLFYAPLASPREPRIHVLLMGTMYV